MSNIVIAVGEQPLELPLSVANRHGLIAGATGTGKTVSLQSLAEGFSRQGVPVFVADVKGDLAGIGQTGADNPKVVERARKLALEGFAGEATPTTYWDVFGEQGLPLRTTVSDMGPLLLGRLMGLSDVQQGVLELAFRVADDQGLLLLDLKDLRSLLTHIGANAKELALVYGNVAAQSVGAIQRSVLALESQGGDLFFGEPALELTDLMRTDNGRGVVNVLAADHLVRNPRVYAGFLLWLLAELFEELPEVGDRDKPRLIFFFDEAHLLFDDAPKALVDQVEQVVRLIRSKGVGVYLVTQSPMDVPDEVLGQLGHRIQHALRAFTPRDQKAVRAAAQTFRPNPKLSAVEVLPELGVGEALVSLLDTKGVPGVVQRALIAPPRSRLGPVTAAERRAAIEASPLAPRYAHAIDRESAHEVLQQRARQALAAKEASKPAPVAKSRGRSSRPPGEVVVDQLAKGLARGLANSLGSRAGRALARGIFGALLRR